LNFEVGTLKLPETLKLSLGDSATRRVANMAKYSQFYIPLVTFESAFRNFLLSQHFKTFREIAKLFNVLNLNIW